MCTASVTEGVPRWRKGTGQGWLTAEYAMLPAATHDRSDRESVKGRVGGRTQEISRLIGRSLRACIDLAALGENTIAIDCDVLQADGGTRTAAITGAYVALADAVTWLAAGGKLADPRPLSCAIAAVSVGVVDGRVRTDLPYTEDSRAEVDMNVVATDTGTLIEVQGTGEGATFPRSTLDKLLDVALADACARIERPQAMVRSVAAVSVGVVDGTPVLDLDYPEDVSAGTDMNVVATGDGELIEVQGTAEGAPFSRAELDALLDLGLAGCAELTRLQRQALEGEPGGRG